MSRLEGRLRQLEARYGGCPGCAERPRIVGFSCPSRPWTPPPDEDVGPCPDCGEPRDVIIIRLSFDWDAPEAEGPAPGSVQWEREQQLQRPRPNDERCT
jgi:hypothetical protein